MLLRKLRIALQLLVGGLIFLIGLFGGYLEVEEVFLGLSKVLEGTMPGQELLVYALSFLVFACIALGAFLLLRLSVRQWWNLHAPHH